MARIYDENGNDVDLDEWLKQKKAKLIRRESTIEKVQRYADVYEVPYGENILIDAGWFLTLADNAYKKGRADAFNQRENADGCVGCAFELENEWELPCAKCKRNAKDYWRAKEQINE